MGGCYPLGGPRFRQKWGSRGGSDPSPAPFVSLPELTPHPPPRHLRSFFFWHYRSPGQQTLTEAQADCLAVDFKSKQSDKAGATSMGGARGKHRRGSVM